MRKLDHVKSFVDDVREMTAKKLRTYSKHEFFEDLLLLSVSVVVSFYVSQQ